MKNELHILSSYVGLLVMSRPIYNNTEVLKSVKTECGRLKEMLLFSFNQAQERFQITESLNNCYAHLVNLADTLWDKAREHNPIARSALLAVVSLIHYTEQQYGNFLDKNHALTAFERFTLIHSLSAKLTTIERLLVLKNISSPLIFQIVKAFEDLFKEGRGRPFSCADRNYVKMLLPKLSSLASDERDKDWNRRLRLLLIKNNVNHMGIYKLLEAENEKEILIIKDKGKQHDRLYHKELWLEQIEPIVEVAYNCQDTDLKSKLVKHIKTFGPYLTRQMEIKNGEKHAKFKHLLSVDELSVEFHYECAEKLYDYSSKKESAEAYCTHNQSIGTDDISVNSFMNFDKLGQRNAALKYYQRISRIQKKLKKDFDF